MLCIFAHNGYGNKTFGKTGRKGIQALCKKQSSQSKKDYGTGTNAIPVI
jgi:hypothetical protein